VQEPSLFHVISQSALKTRTSAKDVLYYFYLTIVELCREILAILIAFLFLFFYEYHIRSLLRIIIILRNTSICSLTNDSFWHLYSLVHFFVKFNKKESRLKVLLPLYQF
jgi:hypothetical protein